MALRIKIPFTGYWLALIPDGAYQDKKLETWKQKRVNDKLRGVARASYMKKYWGHKHD